MGNRRVARIATSDDEEDDDLQPPPPPTSSSTGAGDRPKRRKRKRVKLDDDDDEEEEDEGERESKKASVDNGDTKEEAVPEDAKPIGEVVRVSGKGRGRRSHYDAFEYDGLRYDLEDPVLLSPEEAKKPYVAIIKDITQSKNGSLMLTGQWFYRPEEAEKKGGGNWQSRDTRELFYSFHRDDIPAESVMHKCVVHFIPLDKQIPIRKQHPGFFVQKVYDTEQRRLFKLTDKDYEDNKQHEIDILVQKTILRLGGLLDIETTEDNAADQEDQLKNKKILRRKNVSPLDTEDSEDIAAEQEDQLKNKKSFKRKNISSLDIETTEGSTADQEDQLKKKKSLRRKNMSPLEVSRDDEAVTSSGQPLKAETPGSATSNASEYYSILVNFKVLTGETLRDKWLERLLQGIQFVCTPIDNAPIAENEKGGSNGSDCATEGKHSKFADESQENNQNDTKSFLWPDAAVIAVSALEKASHDAYPSDFQKYNQKLRQLLFNLKNTALLARRLLNGELEPSKLLIMSPFELKEGFTSEEIASKQPELQHVQEVNMPELDTKIPVNKLGTEDSTAATT